jgi:hypothetical protein
MSLFSQVSHHALIPAKLLSSIELNCRFIDMHPCLRSILDVFHNKNTMYFIKRLGVICDDLIQLLAPYNAMGR